MRDSVFKLDLCLLAIPSSRDLLLAVREPLRLAPCTSGSASFCSLAISDGSDFSFIGFVSLIVLCWFVLYWIFVIVAGWIGIILLCSVAQDIIELLLIDSVVVFIIL